MKDRKQAERAATKPTTKRQWGSDRGRFTVPDDFNAPLEEFEEILTPRESEPTS